MAKRWIIIITVFSIIMAVTSFFSCGRQVLKHEPLKDFIYYASENGLPVQYLEAVNERISIQYRSRPAYSGSTVYLTDSFNQEGELLQFYQLDSFEISSVFHECFHAYADLFIRAGNTSPEEMERFNELMEESLWYYTGTADGRSILWHNYRRQASEEAMAIHITNLIKYKIVYEKTAEKAARNYIYGSIDRDQMEYEVDLANRQWREIVNGKRSRGYYNKSFLRWKFPHIIDAGNYISEKEKKFISKFILPGMEGVIKIPPLTDFIKGCKTDGLPHDFLVEVNKNHFWQDDLQLEPYEEMDQERISQVYMIAFHKYWDYILKRGLSPDLSERDAFRKMLGAARKWYTGPISDAGKIEEIIKNAASDYIGDIILARTRWQDEINSDLLGDDDFDSAEFEISWKNAVQGRGVHGFYLADGVVIRTPMAMTLDEKEFIIEHILPDIDYSFGPLVVTGPLPAEGEIEAEAGVFAELVSTEGHTGF